MKKKLLVGLVGALLVGAGCVKTVNDRHTAAVPLVKDKIEARYQRTAPQVYAAATDVIRLMGTVSREATLYEVYEGTNAVQVVEGKVNGRNVWVRVQAVDPTVTSVRVQARTSAGGTDMNLVYEIEKRIAVKLAAP